MPFDRALIVEDLDEPRQWLAELLPQALECVKQVDTAANLAQAYAHLKARPYGLALVDWGLPDGTSEHLIADLVRARPDAIVIVATIHDDDAHVFPALRAGATGYILKSQPRAVVFEQLRRIELGEPALSPSIAMRMLKHFQIEKNAGNFANVSVQSSPNAIKLGLLAAQELEAAAPQNASKIASDHPLTLREIDVLRLIAKGYKAPEAAAILSLTSSTVSSYIREIYRKLGISSRAEAAMEANRRGLVQ
jgi:DNA-binding NarL/FixJ family response regulator